MIDLNGNAIALKMGRTSEKNYTDHFLPLHRPVRTLQYIRRNEIVPRGTIQVIGYNAFFSKVSSRLVSIAQARINLRSGAFALFLR
jgi:hypothetical protein